MVAITLRNVPEDVRDELAARAARSGRSLQEYLLTHLIQVASRPSVEDVIGRARQRAQLTDTRLDVAVILTDRDAERPLATAGPAVGDRRVRARRSPG